MSDPSTQRYAVASIEGPSRTGISDEGSSEVRAGLVLGQRTSFKTEIKLSSFGRALPGTSFEEPP